MAKSTGSRILGYLREWRKFIASKRVIPTLKGVLAYTLAVALIFIKKYDDLSRYPLALSSMIIVTVAGGPGKTIGACLQSTGLAMAGVLLGCGFFAILALLAAAPVAQGIVLAMIVYLMAIVRTRGQRWFIFVLLSILVAFNGIYTPMLSGNTFNPMYLLEYLKSYAWGAAIVISVNFFVFPRTSERELRKTMVTSLEHLATFAALIGKAYTLTGTEEDQEARELLSQTVKADFTFLTEKINETSVEINWSVYSMEDYQRFTDHIRLLQRTLITAHISLLRLDKKDIDVFRDTILPPTKASFMRLRRDIDLTIREIGDSLGCGPMFVEATQSGYLEYLDRERAADAAGKIQPVRRTSTAKSTLVGAAHTNRQEGRNIAGKEAAESLFQVSKRVQQELGSETPAQMDSTRPSTPAHHDTNSGSQTPRIAPEIGTQRKGYHISSESPLNSTVPVAPSKKKYGPAKIKEHFKEFEAAQKKVLVEILTSSDIDQDAPLKIHEPGPSISELYGGDYLRGNVEEGDLPDSIVRCIKVPESSQSTPAISSSKGGQVNNEKTQSRVSNEHQGQGREASEDDDSSTVQPTPQFKRNETLVRVYSLLFAWDGFVKCLSTLHAEALKKRRRRFHFHVYETIVRPGRKVMPDIGIDDSDELQEEARELSTMEALALLENKPYTPPSSTLFHKIGNINQWLSGDTSVFAFKSAAAASVFATLIFAETTRQWFINYGLTSGLLTCIVALAPTLGQSLRTFVFQICGSGVGAIAGWTILQIFKGVGGYSYNPYGICALLGIFSVPLQYCVYENAQLFVLAFLALNSASSVVIIEYLNVDYLGNTAFDSPALRAGKYMVSLGVALAIVITFQLFVLRNPARRTLRKAIGALVFSNLAYNTILQAYVRAVMPPNPEHRGRPAVLKRIERELKHREAKMQMQIIDIGSLMAYASVEPSFTTPFPGETIQKIVQANQIILDRLREGRAAIGAEPCDPFILENMVSVLSPYRRRASRNTKIGLYLCAMSLMSKSPLPHDSDVSQAMLNHFIHDVLILSSQLLQHENGMRAIHGGSYTRYLFYLINVSGVQTQLHRINAACRELFGVLEDNPELR